MPARLRSTEGRGLQVTKGGVEAGGSNIEFGRLSKLNCLGRSKLRPGSANLNFTASSNYPVHQGFAFFKASQVL